MVIREEEMDSSNDENNVMCILTDSQGTIFLKAQALRSFSNLRRKFLMLYIFLTRNLSCSLEIICGTINFSGEGPLNCLSTAGSFLYSPVRRCSSTITGHADSILSVAFSPDGVQLTSGSGDTTVRLWDLNTQTPLHTCSGHKNWVMCVAWSPDGKQLVSGSKAGELQCWNPLTGQESGKPVMVTRLYYKNMGNYKKSANPCPKGS